MGRAPNTSALVLLAFSALKAQSSYAQIGGNGLCADPASLGPNAPVGGFSPVSDVNNPEVTAAAQAAAIEYFNNSESECFQQVIEACGNPSAEDFASSVEVLAACNQVVAGVNYKVAFSATIPCSDVDEKKLNGTDQLKQTFEAEVFQPLPSDNGGEGQSTEVTSVTLTEGVCTGVNATPSPTPEPAPIIGGNGLCADPASLGPNAPMAGAYKPVTPDERATEAAEAAALKAWNDESKCYEEVISVCGATEESFVDSVTVTAACEQVVAGINYKLAFTTEIQCDDASRAKLKDTKQLQQTWEAEVFVPLPSSGGADEVTSVTETSGTCTGVRSALAPAPEPTPTPGPAPEPTPTPGPAPGPTPEPSSATMTALSGAILIAAALF